MARITIPGTAFNAAGSRANRKRRANGTLSNWEGVTFDIENPTFGLRAAGAALLANESYYQGQPVKWDPEAMKLI